MTGERAAQEPRAESGAEPGAAAGVELGAEPGGHQPGDPTPVPGGQVGLATGLATGLARDSAGCLGEFVLETVGGVLLLALTTGSLAGAFFLAQTLHRTSPAAAYALAAAGLYGLVHGIRHRRRPKEQRTRFGRITAGIAGALGLWLILCVGNASFDTAFGLNIGL
ncbi:hypothetical protein [Kitasatospora sp. NPDC059160]|uniref:hypothetical protein n=1 Tax=Kitasatospora sp. NPDC059160 TaxID=3346748 RepID=UPI0036AA0953